MSCLPQGLCDTVPAERHVEVGAEQRVFYCPLLLYLAAAEKLQIYSLPPVIANVCHYSRSKIPAKGKDTLLIFLVSLSIKVFISPEEVVIVMKACESIFVSLFVYLFVARNRKRHQQYA